MVGWAFPIFSPSPENFPRKIKFSGLCTIFWRHPRKTPKKGHFWHTPPTPQNPGVTFFCGKGDRFHSKWPDFHDFGAFDKEGGTPLYPQKGSKSTKIGPLSWECPPDHPLLRLTVGFPNITFILFIHHFILYKFFWFLCKLSSMYIYITRIEGIRRFT